MWRNFAVLLNIRCSNCANPIITCLYSCESTVREYSVCFIWISLPLRLPDLHPLKSSYFRKELELFLRSCLSSTPFPLFLPSFHAYLFRGFFSCFLPSSMRLRVISVLFPQPRFFVFALSLATSFQLWYSCVFSYPSLNLNSRLFGQFIATKDCTNFFFMSYDLFFY